MPSSPDAGAPRPRPRATILGAWLEGWRRVLRAPVVATALVLLTFLLALPLALVLGGMIESHLGASAEADAVASGWHAGWAGEFAAQAQGLGRTFSHEILGFGGTLATLSRLLDNQALPPVLAGLVVVYIALWIFVSGGVVDRLARGRPVGAAAFFSACGGHFLRLLRLAAIAGACYWGLFARLHPYLFGTLYDRFTRDMTEERDALLVRVLLYAAFLVLLGLVSLITDFARVRVVVEDRHSVLSALAAALRFIRRRFFRVVALYMLNILTALIVLRFWLQVAPAADAPVWWAFLIGQVYALLRIWARLAFLASEVTFFQGELAHAGYTAGPFPRWPESAAAEAIQNLTMERRS